MGCETQRSEIDVVDPKQTDLTGAQAMTVGDEEQYRVAGVRPRCDEQARKFIERQELDRVG
jgi:hypothetical protein